MKKFLAALLVAVMVFTVSIPKQHANADALVISQLAAAAYAIATGSGMNFAFTAGTAGGAQTYMEQRLSSWVGNQSGGISIFGSTPVKALAAKLAITQAAFLKLKDFINDLITTENIGTTSVSLSPGSVGGVEYNTWTSSFGQTSGFWCTQDWTSITSTSSSKPGYQRGVCEFAVGYGSQTLVTKRYDSSSKYNHIKFDAWKIFHDESNSSSWTVYIRQLNDWNDSSENVKLYFTYQGVNKANVISAVIPDGMTYPEVGVDDLQTYKRQDWASDTNLEQMISDIYDDVSNNDLDLTGETVEDTPIPTPAPTNPPTTDIPGALGGIQEGINDLIGTQTGILEGVDDITGALEGVQEGVGTISEALEGVGSDVGSIAEALEVPTANELRLPDLRTLFPFCIPFDLYNIISAFAVEPQAPHVQIPFNIPRIGLEYTFDFDFSSFNTVAQVCRTMEFIAFAIGLAILTSKVIRW